MTRLPRVYFPWAALMATAVIANAFLLPFNSPLSACTAVVVGKGATACGGVIVGHNEVNPGDPVVYFRKIPRLRFPKDVELQLLSGERIPQVEETFAFLWSEIPGSAFSDAYLNEWGVAVTSDACPGRAPAAGKISYSLRRIVAQRARTAREGVELAGGLVERLGYPSSRTYVVADPREAWLLALPGGQRWMAQRVPDDGVAVLPNTFITGEIDLADRANFLGSPDLIDHAVRRGWHDADGGKPFRFWKAYGPAEGRLLDLRQWRGQSLVTGAAIPLQPDRKLPFSVTPSRKLSVKDVIDMLRDHGRGALCTSHAQEAAVFQLRAGMPAAIGCVYWRVTGEPCVGALTPWHAGIEEAPAEYHDGKEPEQVLTLDHHFNKPAGDAVEAWKLFKRLQDAVNRDRPARLPRARAIFDRIEAEGFEAQAAVERQASALFPKEPVQARRLLTDHCARAARKAIDGAQRLLNEFRVE